MNGSSHSVALIACPNGMGHARRMTGLANSLVSLGCDVSLFLPYYAKDKLKVFSPDKRIKKQFIRINSVEDVIANPAGFMRKIGSLDDFDQVISDNCLEILRFRQDAWLSGSFLWHETGVPWLEHSYILESRALLEDLQPRMISSALFSASYLSGCTRLHEVGLYGADVTPQPNPSNKDSLLISCGLGGPLERETADFVSWLAKRDLPTSVIKRVWVDPSLVPKASPTWMQPADFSSAMYASVRASVVRPGVGVVTDSLSHSAKIFAFFEDQNHEMRDNAAKLEASEIGKLCSSVLEACQLAISYANSPSAIRYFEGARGRIKFGGGQDAASLVMSMT